MENQVILACSLEDLGPYFSKWVNGRRQLGRGSPYSALRSKHSADLQPFVEGYNIPLTFGPLTKWSED